MTIFVRFQLLFFRALKNFVLVLPYPAAVFLGRLVGLIAWALLPFQRKIVATHVRHTLRPENEAGFVRRVFMNQGVLYVDMIRVAYMDDAALKEKVIVEGRSNLDDFLASGRNLMIIAGHMNWEILGHTPRIFDIEICVMADFIKSPAVQAIADEIRSKCRIRVLPPKGGMVRRNIDELKAGRIVGMVIDQRGKRENRLFCDVLGLPAPTNPAPAFIALKGDALILPLSAVRKGDKYIFRFHELIDSRNFGDDCHQADSVADSWKSTAVRNLSCAMHSWMSSVVRETPDQWFWLHSRWLRRQDMRKVIRDGADFSEIVNSQAEDYHTREKM